MKIMYKVYFVELNILALLGINQIWVEKNGRKKSAIYFFL